MKLMVTIRPRMFLGRRCLRSWKCPSHVPGCVQSRVIRSFDEAIANIREAIALCIDMSERIPWADRLTVETRLKLNLVVL